MKTIEVSVKDKLAIRTNDMPYICDNSDYSVKFDFDNEWSEYVTKTARFIYDESHIDVVFDGDTCPIPVISDVSRIYVGVFAGSLHTTTPAVIYARRSILSGGGSPGDPPQSVYDQIMERLNSLDSGSSSPDLTDEQLLQSLIAANVLSAVTSGGAILTDENHNILMM